MIKVNSESYHQRLAQIQKDLADNHRTLDYLVIAHPDPLMLQQLSNALGNKSFAILAMPQSNWSVQDTGLVSLVQTAIQSGQVKRVLLVGHSEGGTGEIEVHVCTSESTGNLGNKRTGSLFDRVNEAQSLKKANERHFVNVLTELEQKVVAEMKNQPELSPVRGLFYRRESGVFCILDPEHEQFFALTDCLSVA